LKKICRELSDITVVFDKGNNSKDNFHMLDGNKDFHYVCGLVPSYFKELIREANQNFATMKIRDEQVPVFRIKKRIWGKQRTCVVTVSAQLKEGQIRGIHQHLKKKYKELEEFKQQLENPKRRKTYDKEEIESRLTKMIKGQFVEEILKYELIELEGSVLTPIIPSQLTCWMTGSADSRQKKRGSHSKVIAKRLVFVFTWGNVFIDGLYYI